MIKTLIFDWDGTLHETAGLYGHAFRKAYRMLAEQGYAKERLYRDEDVSCYLGMNVNDMWNSFMPDLPRNVQLEAAGIIGEEMIAGIEAGHAKLYPDAADTLDILKRAGYEQVILSNCKRAYLEAHRRAFGLDKWFSGFYCCEDYGLAPKEEIFLEISKRHPADYAVIGDRDSDIKVSETHNLVSIGCLYGYGSAEELESATCTARSIAEIPGLLAGLKARDDAK